MGVAIGRQEAQWPQWEELVRPTDHQLPPAQHPTVPLVATLHQVAVERVPWTPSCSSTSLPVSCHREWTLARERWVCWKCCSNVGLAVEVTVFILLSDYRITCLMWILRSYLIQPVQTLSGCQNGGKMTWRKRLGFSENRSSSNFRGNSCQTGSTEKSNSVFICCYGRQGKGIHSLFHFNIYTKVFI